MHGKKPYYSLKEVKRLISTPDCHSIRSAARETARNDFGWEVDEIKRAFMKLQEKHFHKRSFKFDNPKLHVDVYKAKGLLGENIYIHFRIEDGVLFICSFKRI